MKKTFYLHIGRPKVGSTALQHFLWQNREKLAGQGILYPESVLHHRASHKLALVFQPNLPGYRVVANQGAEKVYAAFRDEAERSSARAVVASSENLFLIDPAKIKQALGKHFDVRIICYVRRQDEVLTSSFVQELKAGAVQIDEDIAAYASEPERMKWLDYCAVIDRWAKQFGRRNIIVRVYEQEQMEGNIFEDFAAIIGANISGLSLPKNRVNPSPARDVLDFIRVFNEVPIAGPDVKRIFRDPLLAASEKLGYDGPWNPRALVPPEIRQHLLDHFRDSNADLARRYLGRKNGVLFQHEEMPEVAADDVYQGMTLDRFANMTATLFTFQQQQIQQLKKQVENLRQQLSERSD